MTASDVISRDGQAARTLTVGVLTRLNEPCSLCVYNENTLRELAALGVRLLPFPERGPIPPGCNLVWDPGLAMRRTSPILRTSPVPVVGTMHGVKAFSLPLEELTANRVDRWSLWWLKRAVAGDWRRLGPRIAAVIAVSNYSAEETASAFQLSRDKVHVVYHGVDRRIFEPDGERAPHPRPYFFHVSGRNPIKNLGRLLAAYARLEPATRPDLVAVLPDQRKRVDIEGVLVIRRSLTQAELARWYRGAIGTVFPSLRETFGMPILEAMACGCPVITSNGTGCAEVAGDAALLVDPRSSVDISFAMERLMSDETLRLDLRQRGFVRVEPFTWQSSAEKLLRVFQQVVSMAGDQLGL